MGQQPEERRTFVSVECHRKILGIRLAPVNTKTFQGVMVDGFVSIDNEIGEVEASGLVDLGFILSHINEKNVTLYEYDSIVNLLVMEERPIRLTFRNPDVPEYRDRYGFLRTKLFVDSEESYLNSRGTSSQENDLAWIEYLRKLGGERGVSFGVKRLLRDANGELLFPTDPDSCVNYLSPPDHTGLPSDYPLDPFVQSEGMDATELPSCRSRLSSSNPSSTTASPTRIEPISIYRRCWSPASPGCTLPPGLMVSLPGDPPPTSVREFFFKQLETLIVQGGIPEAYRPAIWWELSGGHAKSKLHPKNYYHSLLQFNPDAEVRTSIAKDISRTFPGHSYFDSLKGKQALTRVLEATAVHNPEVGYTQSMNFLAGVLLLLLEEEQAFWVLDVMVNEILPQDYYTPSLLGVQADQKVLSLYVDKYIPEVSQAYRNAGIDLQLATVEWDKILSLASSSTTSKVKITTTTLPTRPNPNPSLVSGASNTTASTQPYADPASKPSARHSLSRNNANDPHGPRTSGSQGHTLDNADLISKHYYPAKQMSPVLEYLTSPIRVTTSFRDKLSRTLSLKQFLPDFRRSQSMNSVYTSALQPATASSHSTNAPGVHSTANASARATTIPATCITGVSVDGDDNWHEDTVARTAHQVLSAAVDLGVYPIQISSSASQSARSSEGGDRPTPLVSDAQSPSNTHSSSAQTGASFATSTMSASLASPTSQPHSPTQTIQGAAGTSASSTASIPSTPSAIPTTSTSNVMSTPFVKGGTVRSATGTFSALFSMLKSLPLFTHSIDPLLRYTYPTTPEDNKYALKQLGLDWSYCTHDAILSLHQRARQHCHDEIHAHRILDERRMRQREAIRQKKLEEMQVKTESEMEKTLEKSPVRLVTQESESAKDNSSDSVIENMKDEAIVIQNSDYSVDDHAEGSDNESVVDYSIDVEVNSAAATQEEEFHIGAV